MARIRIAKSDDAEAIRDIYAPYVTSTPISFDTEVPTVAYFEADIRQRLLDYPWLVAVSDDAIVGYAYAGRHQSRSAYRWSVDASIYLRDSHLRMGIGSQLYDKLLAILRRQGYRMVHAGITLPNAASIGLHEAFGFEKIAVYPNVGFKLGAWRDVGWWSLDLMPDMASESIPREPIAFESIALSL